MRWRDWLLRAAAGDPDALQTMYGVAGERRLTELELDWLPGYGGRPAGAHRQRRARAAPARRVRRARRRAVAVGAAGRHDAERRARGRCHAAADSRSSSGGASPTRDLGGARRPRRHFTHSKVMCWVAFDRAVAHRSSSSGSTARSTSGAICGTRSTTRSAHGVQREDRCVHADLRLRPTSTRRC